MRLSEFMTILIGRAYTFFLKHEKKNPNKQKEQRANSEISPMLDGGFHAFHGEAKGSNRWRHHLSSGSGFISRAIEGPMPKMYLQEKQEQHLELRPRISVQERMSVCLPVNPSLRHIWSLFSLSYRIVSHRSSISPKKPFC